MELVRRNGDIKIDRSRWWLERGGGVGKKEERKKERHGGNGLGEGGMYGDFESCDSTIKLGEFCSWLVVVPATLYFPLLTVLHPLFTTVRPPYFTLSPLRFAAQLEKKKKKIEIYLTSSSLQIFEGSEKGDLNTMR